MMMQIRPAGPTALLVELADLDEVLALSAEVARRRAGGWAPELVDVVPGGRTLLLDGLADPAAVADQLAGWTVPPVPATAGELVEIACCYDGPDLADVAEQWGTTPEEVGQRHASMPHTVAFCGFSPGFAYLAGLDAAHAVSRRRTPRTMVPAGSVAVGGPYTGIYPRPSPGGWQLIGRTDAVLWDTDRDPAALLRPGCRVRFVPVSSVEQP
ncbi:MAG TPA: allophanate hydrolase subunit 1 [Acidimicrobiales bacterium]|nr:allophanate hydrolase subunit 1 [Acidimicrobiales bacterium]